MKVSMQKASEVEMVLGLDLSDRWSTFVGLDADGVVVEEGKVATTDTALKKMFDGRAPMRIAIEAGTHSAWVSRELAALGHEVIVANPRQLPLIYRSRHKNDRMDATSLARLARLDPQLLKPLKHRSKEGQAALAILRSRDMLVASRTALISHARGVVKSYGARLPSCSAESFARKAATALPPDLLCALGPILETVSELNNRIKGYDREIERLIAKAYPEALVLQQVGGVGPITSLAFVLTIEDPGRFNDNRDVAAYLGLTPGQHQSGQSDPQLHITKSGNVLLRRLLVQCGHYIIGPLGPDCDLKRWGMRLAGKGSHQRKKRAVVAVARKLAVLLHALWMSGELYDPLRQTTAERAA